MPKPAFVSSRSRTCCDSEVNYTENIQKNVLTCDLADNEIQLDLLGDKNQDMTLKEEFHFVEAKKADK